METKETKLAIPAGWVNALGPDLQKLGSELRPFLSSQRAECTVYPKKSDTFRALQLTDFNDVKVVIIGQDPYHQKNQANGLAFAVNSGVKPPPSLKNIFRELVDDLMVPIDQNNGTLIGWAKQGVLLLNTALTVREGEPESHLEVWRPFTDAIITALNKREKRMVFLLWGNYAKNKKKLFGYGSKHAILEAGHPSPLSCRMFFGCRHFSQANYWLREFGENPIDWSKIND
jgi:uracil-DNA glycosylase